MPRYNITCTMIHNASVEVSARSEEEALEKIRTRLAKADGTATRDIVIDRIPFIFGEATADCAELIGPARKPTRLTLYTDGGYHLYKDEGAYAYIILKGTKVLSKNAAVIRHESNNRGELKAIIEGVEACPVGSEILVKSDSQYAINTLSGEWSRKKNTDLFERWDEVLRLRKVKVSFQWVRGHNGDKYNEMCDRMCDEAVGYDLNSWIPKQK